MYMFMFWNQFEISSELCELKKSFFLNAKESELQLNVSWREVLKVRWVGDLKNSIQFSVTNSIFSMNCNFSPIRSFGRNWNYSPNQSLTDTLKFHGMKWGIQSYFLRIITTVFCVWPEVHLVLDQRPK